MAATITPSRKRAREDDADQENGEYDDGRKTLGVASAKKRRLQLASSPSTPKTLNAISSAISGALAGAKQKNGHAAAEDGRGDVDMSYEVPDSDEERAREQSKKSSSSTNKTAGAGRSVRNSNAANVYDVPGSDDDDDEGDAAATPSKRSGGKSASGRGSSTKRTAAGRSSQRKALDDGEDGENNVLTDTTATLEDDNNTPTKPRSTRRSLPATAIEKDGTETNSGMAEDEGTPRRAVELTPSGRKKRDPLAELVIDGTPRLKGILTPSRKDKGGSDRPQKNVAFEQGSKEKKKKSEEVFFADLPGKKTGRSPKPPAQRKASASPRSRKKEVVPAPPKILEAEKEESSGEDDTPCAVCGDPESGPSNDIIFCDNCDLAVHQQCYHVPVIPEGDWLCKTCSQEDYAPPEPGAAVVSKPAAAADEVPDIPNFDTHLRSWQRVLLDRCTGRRRMKLRGQDEAYDKTYQLVEQTVLAGEGNSMMVIGARGSGKTTMVESVVSALAASYKEEFHVVRLNGFIHTDDKLALKEIWRQLGREMEVEDDLVNKTNNYADTLASLLALLSHPSEMSGAEPGVTSKSVVFIIDEFDLFAAHARQTLLYNLFDIAQARKAPIAVLGLTTRIDVVESLEKRVKSRFSHRYVYLGLPKSLPAYWDVVRHGLSIDAEELATEGIDTKLEGHKQFLEWWTTKIGNLRKDDAAFQDHLEYHFYTSKSVPSFLATCILPLSGMTPTSPSLKVPGPTALPSLAPPDSNLHLLGSLSDLDLGLLIAAARLDVVAHTDTVNLAMAYDEYASLVGRQRAQSAGAGMLAGLGGGVRVWGRGVAGAAWERLAGLGLLVPTGPGGRGCSGAAANAGQGGLEAKMWKVDVALEEIPAATRLSAVLARWCREI